MLFDNELNGIGFEKLKHLQTIISNDGLKDVGLSFTSYVTSQKEYSTMLTPSLNS